MKTSILFILLASTLFNEQFSPKAIVLSHSDYKKSTGMACVLYDNNFYNMKWFGIDKDHKRKRWIIKEVDECSFGSRNSDFKDVINKPEKAPAEILAQLKLLKSKTPPKHPK